MMEAKAGHPELSASAGGLGLRESRGSKQRGCGNGGFLHNTQLETEVCVAVFPKSRGLPRVDTEDTTSPSSSRRRRLPKLPVVHMFRLLLLQETWYEGSKKPA